MTPPRDYLSSLDRIDAALEATCDALLTLQSIEVLPGVPEDAPGEGHVAQAISHLRGAIDELRVAQSQGHAELALGFVLPRDHGESSGEVGTGQSIPRRTA
jgi:hypothetical protein